MKFLLLATIASAFPGSTTVAKGDYRLFFAKAPKTRKPQHGVSVFDAKATKTKTQKIPVPKTTITAGTTLTNGPSLPIDEVGDNKNSEDGGWIHGTSGSGGSEEGGILLDETLDDDVSPSTQGFDPVNAMFEWLTRCTEVNLDKETCLVTTTLDFLVNMDGPSPSTYPSRRRRVLQGGGCRPELSEQDLRDIMNNSRADCSQVSIDYSDAKFAEIRSEFWKVFSAEVCWKELCESPDIFFKLMFDHAVQCANVVFDVDQCITDQIFAVLVPAPDSYDDHATDDSFTTNHIDRALRSMQEVLKNGDGNTDCVVVNEVELAFFASFVLMEAPGRCAELGVLVTLEDISKASADLVKLFGSPHCWGDAHACHVDIIEPNQDPVGDVNGTSSSSSSIITSTQPTSQGDATASSDKHSDEANTDSSLGSTNTSTFGAPPSEHGDVASFNPAETLDDTEVTNEDHLSASIQEDGSTDVSQPSIVGGINATSIEEEDDLTASTKVDADESSVEEDANESSAEGGANGAGNMLYADGDINDLTSTNGEGNVTSTEEDLGATSLLHENGTSPDPNSSTPENATIPSLPDDARGSIFTPQVTSESCDVGPRSGIERSIEMPYFYIVETVFLEGVVDEIEGLLHLMMCINGVDRRLSVESGEKGVEIVALKSSPKDAVSTQYMCVARSEGAQNCNVIEGMLTLLIVEGDNSFEQEVELMTNFYLHLAFIFDLFSSVEDSNILLLEYVGSDPSSLMARAELIEEEGVASIDSNSLFKFIAIGASIVTLVMLIVGAWKMKDKGDDDSTIDGKPIDDKSLAIETTALTMTTSGSVDDSSDISSTPDAKEFYRNKAFVLAEEEESNWRNLGILPNQLEDIREELSQSGSELADEKSM